MKKWFTKADVKVGMVLKDGPYKGAKVIRVANNGWCHCRWMQTGVEFNARVHWLSYDPPFPALEEGRE